MAYNERPVEALKVKGGDTLVGALKKKGPKLRIEARYDEYGDHEDANYKKRELARLKEKHKHLKRMHDTMDEKQVVNDARASLKSEMARNRARMIEMGDEDEMNESPEEEKAESKETEKAEIAEGRESKGIKSKQLKKASGPGQKIGKGTIVYD